MICVFNKFNEKNKDLQLILKPRVFDKEVFVAFFPRKTILRKVPHFSQSLANLFHLRARLNIR